MNLLKTTLISNATFSVATGFTSLLLADSLTYFFSISEPLFFYVLGIGLILFAIHVARIATLKSTESIQIKVICYADFIWVLASAAVLFTFQEVLSISAMITIIIIAIVVLVFGLIQFREQKKALLK